MRRFIRRFRGSRSESADGSDLNQTTSHPAAADNNQGDAGSSKPTSRGLQRTVQKQLSRGGSTTQPPKASSRCELCNSIVWFHLQPEDLPATPHHKSRRALEQSAKSCGLCNLVLRVAISNHQDSHGIRHGRGYWRVFYFIRIQEASGTVREVQYVKDMGSSPPIGESFSNPSDISGRAVICATGAFDANYDHIVSEEALPNMGNLDLSEPPDDMPVWLYGNWWGAGPSKGGGDSSHLRFMGVGARFGRSPRIFDAWDTDNDQVHLRGSAIRVCTTDGMCDT